MASMFNEDPVFKTNPETVGSLIRSIHDGSLALPNFQRSFVWDPKRTVELIKSIILRYPAGTLLTWEQSSSHRFDSRSFEEAPVNAGMQPRRLVLDGQQRLTALYHALSGKGEYQFFIKAWPFIDPKNRSLIPLEEVELETAIVAYDTRGRLRFNPLDEEWQLENGIFPLSKFQELRRSFKSFARSITEVREEQDALEETLHQLRDGYLQPLESYPFPVVDLPEQTSLLAVCNIFETLNKSAKPLGPFELLTAKFYPSGARLRVWWASAQEEYPVLTEFDIDPYNLLQAVSLRARGTAQRADILGKLTSNELIEHWETTVSAAADVLDMLKRECGVISPQWLPYGMILVPMAAMWPEISALRPQQRGHARERLRQYYWCSIFTENYDQGANSQVGADYKLLKGWVVDGQSQPPEAVANFNLTDADLLSARSNRKALYRGVVTLLIQSGAKDFLSAQAISNIRLSEAKLETVQVFPKGWLQQNSIDTSADLILNRIMVDGEARRSIKGRPVHHYLDSQEAPVQTKLVDVLESHLINAQTEYGFRGGDYDEFLQERLSLILEAIEQVTGQTVILDPDAGEPAAQRE
ncbi:GmrSD restriction endonuclease domain-containing protein [Streptomyces microflavus]|uniref:GmrSD restriction endonuclease domain-containing protein n=1 Tax=Streptomyces microflavus TaxID=1919 RepID=UPI00382D0A6A